MRPAISAATLCTLAAIASASLAQDPAPAPALTPLSTSDVFGLNESGYPQTRIPSVVVTPKGAILAFAETRLNDSDHAENDIILKRSLDSGLTWQPLQLIADMGPDSLNDPCAVALDTGRVLLMYQRYPKGYHTHKMAHTEPARLGYGEEGNCQSFLTFSDDDGVTWSAPQDITRSVRRADAISIGSPGVAIQLTNGPHKGRILFPVYEVMPPGASREWHNCAAISDDGGSTWRLGQRVPSDEINGETNECQLVELPNGDILMDARQTVGNTRKTALSTDAGETWQPMRDSPDLVVPPCMGSIIRVTQGGSDLLLLSAPNTLRERRNGTIFVSADGGKTWPQKHILYPGEFAYSCLTALPGGRVGCLFERDDYAHITFAVFEVPAVAKP